MSTYEIDVFQTVRPAAGTKVRWAATVHDATGKVIASSGVQDSRQAAKDAAARNARAAMHQPEKSGAYGPRVVKR